jgi:hypothetical protein
MKIKTVVLLAAIVAFLAVLFLVWGKKDHSLMKKFDPTSPASQELLKDMFQSGKKIRPQENAAPSVQSNPTPAEFKDSRISGLYKDLVDYKAPLPFGELRSRFEQNHSDLSCSNEIDLTGAGEAIRCGRCGMNSPDANVVFRFYVFPPEQSACTLEEIIFVDNNKRSSASLYVDHFRKAYGTPGTYESTEFIEGMCTYQIPREIWKLDHPYAITTPAFVGGAVFISQKRLAREALIKKSQDEMQKAYEKETRWKHPGVFEEAKKNLKERIKTHQFPDLLKHLCPDE